MKYFDYRDFDLQKLIRLKQKDGRRVGIALPVLNEEKTIAETIRVIRSCESLVDQFIVIDSGSTDRSIEICREAGVRVVKDIEAARDLGMTLECGKGWNLWASIYYLDTELIGWIDSDIQNIDQRFIVGIIGPLLLDRHIRFVKGYYQRPKGDARVTELVARPMINFLYPELVDFVQPLSGEYAASRDFLESAWFYSGYSVEMALLIQAAQTLQKNELCQSYLGLRIHELQDVAGLGKMSSSILRMAFEVGIEQGRLSFAGPIPKSIRRFTSEDGERFRKERIQIADVRLPPMTEVPSYNQR